MDKFHITQDADGFWMLSVERENGDLSLLAHRFASPDHLVENANELIASHKVKAVIVLDPPRDESAMLRAASVEDDGEPAPRKAGV